MDGVSWSSLTTVPRSCAGSREAATTTAATAAKCRMSRTPGPVNNLCSQICRSEPRRTLAPADSV